MSAVGNIRDSYSGSNFSLSQQQFVSSTETTAIIMVHNERRARRKRSKKSTNQGAAANCWAKNSKEARRGDEACVSGAAEHEGGNKESFNENATNNSSSSNYSNCGRAVSDNDNNNNDDKNSNKNRLDEGDSNSSGKDENDHCSSEINSDSDGCLEAKEAASSYIELPEELTEVATALTEDSMNRLADLLAREPDYHPKTDFLFRIDSASEDKVDAKLRDEAIYNLRFLHKFYNLSPECFAHAVNIADRFVVKVKVKPKYMACLATAAYLIAAKMIEDESDWPVPQKLVCMARCGGSANDLERMEAIIRSKLRDQRPLDEAATPLHFLLELRPLFPGVRPFQRAVGELETSLCSVAVYEHRPSALALAIARKHLMPLTAHVDTRAAIEETLGQLCETFQLSQDSLSEAASAVSGIVDRLQTRGPVPRLLVWAVSRRTLVSLMRPSAAAQASLLDPIRED